MEIFLLLLCILCAADLQPRAAVCRIVEMTDVDCPDSYTDDRDDLQHITANQRQQQQQQQQRSLTNIHHTAGNRPTHRYQYTVTYASSQQQSQHVTGTRHNMSQCFMNVILQRSYSTSSPVSTEMGDRSRVCRLGM